MAVRANLGWVSRAWPVADYRNYTMSPKPLTIRFGPLDPVSTSSMQNKPLSYGTVLVVAAAAEVERQAETVAAAVVAAETAAAASLATAPTAASATPAASTTTATATATTPAMATATAMAAATLVVALMAAAAAAGDHLVGFKRHHAR